MGGLAHLLHTALVSANDELKQLNSIADPYMVRCTCAFDRRFLFRRF
jgi:hypothetical protein